ncbi:MAG: TonB-dependent receptor [Desulfobulbaceae bacterium]|nr:TonB-dependent receptor [Desulfobulbaceae bacterium]
MTGKSMRQGKKKLLVSLTVLATLGVGTGPAQGATTDKEKLEEVREMFSSKYQEEDYYRTDRLLLTATGTMRPLHKAPAVASIVTAEEIEQMGATTLEEVLETVPGLHVGASAVSRLDSVFSIRGIHTGFNPQVLFLVNGLPATDAYYGRQAPNFRMPVANIARVEVIRGPGSAIYGADAYAGVINVITKEAKDIDGTKVGARVGSFDTYDTWLQHGGTWGGWDVAASLEWQKSNSDPDRIIDRDLQTILDGGPGGVSNAPGPLQNDYNLVDGHLTLAKGKWTARFWGWLQDDAGTGAGGAHALPASDADGDNVEQLLCDLLYRDTTSVPEWDLSTRLSYFYLHTDPYFQLFPPGSTLFIGDDGNLLTGNRGPVTFSDGAIGEPQTTDHHFGLDLVGFYSGFDTHRLRLGAGAKYIEEKTEEAKNFGPGILDIVTMPGLPAVVDGTLYGVSGRDIFMENQRRRMLYFSAQDEWTFARHWDFTVGVRYDHYSDFGDTVNPRAALVWETRPDLTTKLLYGEAFRPPSFSEQYVKNNPSVLGNPSLEPETIRTWELAFDYQTTKSLRTLLNLFSYKADDLIDYVNGTAQNARNQNGYGLEVEAVWDPTDTLRLQGNFSYQRSKNRDTEELVADAPGMQFYANAHWTFQPQWSVDGQYFWIADRRRATADTRPAIDNYSLVNLTLRRTKIASHWDAAVAARNLFDENVREPGPTSVPNDFPMPSRSFWAEVRYSF